MGMDAGKLRQQITIQQRETGQDPNSGQPSQTWDDWATVWARVVSTKGSEDFKGQQLSPEVDYRVWIRRINGLSPLHRIVFTDYYDGSVHYLEILNVNPSERAIDDMIFLQCKERVDWQPGN